MSYLENPLLSLISATVLSAMTYQNSWAGSFSLYTENSASAIGNFAAGIAAEGADAAIGWYNPAGLILLKKEEMVISGAGVFPSSKLTGTSTFSTVGYDPYVQSFVNIQGAENAFVPAFHYAKPLGEKAAFGVSIVSPFGLSTSWGTSSPVRYSATTSSLLMVDVSPELGGMITDHFSAGLGMDLQWAKIKFNSDIGSPAQLAAAEAAGAPVTPRWYDSTSNNIGTSFAIGYHAGVLGQFNESHTRIGLNYQSNVNHKVRGSSKLTGRLADPTVTDPFSTFDSNLLASNNLEFPNIVTLSGYQYVNKQWSLLGSVVYSGWSSLNRISLFDIASYDSDTNRQALVESTSVLNYRNTWRFALGANYHVTDNWMMRVGGGYDETPTIDAERDTRLPDSNRWALSIGSHYQIRPNIGMDVGYSYLFAQDASVNKLTPLGSTSSDLINATAKNNVQLVGLQVAWEMDKPSVATK